MKDLLLTALGAQVEDRGGTPCAVPVDERALAQVLHVLKDQGGQLGRDLQLSRARLDTVGVIDVRSMTVEAGAGVRLEALERQLQPKSLTLGPLPPSAATMTLAEFVEGRHAGLRAIAGGRLEPLCARLEGLLVDGRRVVTQPGPRSATGPDLSALFLGAGGRLGLLTRAQVRAFRAPAHRGSAAWRGASLPILVETLRRVLADGAWVSHARLGPTPQGAVAALSWSGSETLVEREREHLDRAFAEAGARPTADDALPVASGPEAELGWDEVAAQLEAGAFLALHRLSLATVVAVGGPASATPARSPLFDALRAAFDPASVLGGPP